MGWNPFKGVKKVVSKITGKDKQKKAQEAANRQAAEQARKDKLAQNNANQELAKTKGNDADASGLQGLGESGAADQSTILNGLGGVSPEDLKLAKKKLLGL